MSTSNVSPWPGPPISNSLSAEEQQDKLHSSETKHSGYGIPNPPPATTVQRPPIYANSQQSNKPASTQPPQYGQRRRPSYGTPGSAVPYYRTHSAQYDLLSDRTDGSPRTKLNQTPMQRPHSGLGPPQGTPTGPPGSAGMHTAPGPIPATAPLVIRHDQNGVRWVAFEYSRDRVKMEYNIRCDVESVTVDELPQEFKTENCVYPRACCHKDQYRGNHLHYDTECNAVGWALAQLNPCLRGKRGLIQRAVDSWRNSNQDPRLRSRRVRRMAKIKNTETAVEVSDVPNTPGITTSQGAEPTSMSTEDPLSTLYDFPGHQKSNQGKRSMPVDKKDQSLRLYSNSDITSKSSQTRLRGGIDAGRTELHGDHGSLEERWHQKNRHVPDAEDSPSERESNDTEFSQSSSDISHSVKSDILRSALSPMKRKIVDRVMGTFLETFRSEPNSSGDEESDVDSSTLGESDSHSEGSLADRTEKTRGSDAANKNTGGECGQDREEQQSNQSDACSKTSSNQKDEQCARGSSKSSNGNYGRRKRLRTASTDDSESRSITRRLACPFFKKFSPRPPKAASCCFPGFGSVSRVKEHIYREHRVPNRCGRCFQSFDSDAALTSHLREDERCVQLPEYPEIQVITNDQEALLKCKKRSKGQNSEEDKWKRVFLVLFPYVDESCTPDPYCDYDANDELSSMSDSRILKRYDHFSRERLPDLVRRGLEVAIESGTQGLEERLRSQLPDIVRRSQGELISLFRQQERRSETLETAETNDVRAPARSEEQNCPETRTSARISPVGSSTEPLNVTGRTLAQDGSTENLVPQLNLQGTNESEESAWAPWFDIDQPQDIRIPTPDSSWEFLTFEGDQRENDWASFPHGGLRDL